LAEKGCYGIQEASVIRFVNLVDFVSPDISTCMCILPIYVMHMNTDEHVWLACVASADASYCWIGRLFGCSVVLWQHIYFHCAKLPTALLNVICLIFLPMAAYIYSFIHFI